MKFEDFEIKHEINNTITFVDKEGNEVLCQIIFTIESEKLNKYYAVFSKISDIEAAEDDEQIQVGAAEIVTAEDGSKSLEPVETDEEWEIIEQGLAAFDEQFDELYDGCDCEECHCDDCEHNHCYVDDRNNEVCECDGHCDCHHHEDEKK